VPYYRLQHTLEVNNQYRNNKDGNFDSLNYSTLPINTCGDSFNYQMAAHIISNTISLSVLGNKKLVVDSTIKQRRYLLDIAAEHQLINVKNYGYQLDTFNLNFHSALRSNPSIKNKFIYNLEADYAASGYNKSNYKLAGFVSYNFVANNLVYASFTNQKFAANYSMMNFSSRYYSVINNLPNSNFNQFKIGYKNSKHKISIAYCYSTWDKYNYISNGFQAATINDATVSIFKIEKDFNYKKIHFNNLIQYSNQNSSKTIFPKWMYSGQLYYQNFAFKKAMFLQIGLQLISIEKYYAPYFMPIADNFYYQNQTMISQQHQLQFFINAKIKKVRIFVKADNLLQGTDGHGTYVTKYYPLPDRTIKFGISWRFLD
jgi:hypothetical protein